MGGTPLEPDATAWSYGPGATAWSYESGATAWSYTDYGQPYVVAAQQPPLTPFVPLDPSWDPAEELEHLLRDQAAADDAAFLPDTSFLSDAAFLAEPTPEPSEEMAAEERLTGLAQITSELPPVRTMPAHRRVQPRRPTLSRLQRASYFIAAVAAVVVSMVSVLGGMLTYDPLRQLAGIHAPYSSGWPLLVYGPWVVATLSILRAALHRRRAAHSWSVVLFFSSIAMFLCIAQAPRTITGAATAALPALAALACFQQLVRQITLTRPPRKAVRRRRASAPPPSTYRHPKQIPKQKTGARVPRGPREP
ncbi:DUF2637 domain-containing protein [Streptomyces sp. NPDC000410]|uniref:DUF2637 domain-containing protein n=1 Tax=Streptomyces sp. NPDC000410 TaxID=3154254 RepID=UPI0033298439